MADRKHKAHTPVVLIILLLLLVAITGSGIWAAFDGFYLRGWLTSYWEGLTDAQGAIVAQLLFFFAAMWASVLVPILFGEQLRDLKAAAGEAQRTYDEIQQKLAESAEESKRQFRSISRYQQMALGYFANDGLLSSLETAEDKKDFIDNAWVQVEPKVEQAIRQLNGNTRNSIRTSVWRSSAWWDRVRNSQALGDHHEAFRSISDAKREVQQGADAPFSTLKKVNDALRQVRDFDPMAQDRPDAAPESLPQPLAPQAPGAHEPPNVTH